MANRRWFRFSLRTFLLLPPLVLGILWFWTTMPERTARRFVNHMRSGRLDEASAMLDANSTLFKVPRGDNYIFGQIKPSGSTTIGTAKDWQYQFIDIPIKANYVEHTCTFQVYAATFTARSRRVSVSISDPWKLPPEVENRGLIRTFHGTMGQGLDAFHTDCGAYPTEKQGLAALVNNPGLKGWNGPYHRSVDIEPKDPWLTPYRYQTTGDGYTLSSAGKDETFDTEDDVAMRSLSN
jgi:hypothetical protein